MSKILVVAAHPDDELLGLGGTIRKRVNNGDTAYCVILGEGLTSRTNKREGTERSEVASLHHHANKAGHIIGFSKMYFESLPDNRFDSLNMLDIVKIIEHYISILKPDVIYTHHNGDRNIDHRITCDAVLTASRPVGNDMVKDIYTFETPSSTEWGFKGQQYVFSPNVFEDITETLEDKLKAMSQYTSELRDYPHPRSLKALEIIAARWGTVVGKQYVEPFQLIRSIRE